MQLVAVRCVRGLLGSEGCSVPCVLRPWQSPESLQHLDHHSHESLQEKKTALWRLRAGRPSHSAANALLLVSRSRQACPLPGDTCL